MGDMDATVSTDQDPDALDRMVRARMVAAFSESLEAHAAAVGRVDLVDRLRALPVNEWPPAALVTDVAAACGDSGSVLDGMESRLEQMAAADEAVMRSSRRRLRAYLEGAASLLAAPADALGTHRTR